MRHTSWVLSAILAGLLTCSIAAAPPEITSPKYLGLRHNGGWGAPIWTLTVHDDGTVVYEGWKDGAYRCASYRLSPVQQQAVRDSVKRFNDSGLPEYVGGEGTDSPQLTVWEFTPTKGSGGHTMDLSSPESPATKMPANRKFMKLWYQLVRHLGVPSLELPYGPKNLR